MYNDALALARSLARAHARRGGGARGKGEKKGRQGIKEGKGPRVVRAAG